MPPIDDEDDEPRLTEAQIMQGDPRNGAPDPESQDDDEDGDEGSAEPQRKTPKWQEALDQMRRENTQMMQQLIGALASNRGGADQNRQEATPAVAGLSPEEVEELMFKDPAKLIQHIERSVEAKVEQRLTGKYKEERGRETFWDKFYSKNPDLEDDRDLVDATLSRHMTELKDVPVDRAMEQLASLTRTRIAGYVANRRTGKKATAESSGAPAGRTGTTPVTPTRAAPQTLSQALKQRALRRSGRGRAA